MATPQLMPMDAYDVNVGSTIYFIANNGYQTVKSSRLYILDSEGYILGNHLYYSNNMSDATTKHVIDPKDGGGWIWTGDTDLEKEYNKNRYTNNSQYIAYIVTYSDESGSMNASYNSNKVGVWALPMPTLDMSIPPEQRNPESTSYNISILYDSNNPIINNPPSSVKFELYRIYGESDQRVVNESPTIYTSGVITNDKKYLLSYTFENLVNGVAYYISAIVTSTQGMIVLENSDIIIPQISIPPINVIQVENDACNGCINISSQLTNIDGKMKDGEDPMDYISVDGMQLNPTPDKPWVKEVQYSYGLSFSLNWNLAFWANDFHYATDTTLGSEEYILHLMSREVVEDKAYIDVFMVEAADPSKQKAVMYIYPIGHEGEGILLESNEVDKPVSANHEFTYIKIRYKDSLCSIELTEPIVIEPEE